MPHRKVHLGNHTQQPPRGYKIAKNAAGYYYGLKRDGTGFSVGMPIDTTRQGVTTYASRWRAVEACHRHAHQHAPILASCQSGHHRDCRAGAWQCGCYCHPTEIRD